MPVPQNWTDDGSKLTAPNGHWVVLGFRDHILNAPSWDTGNEPLEEEYHSETVLLHNPSAGAGQVQLFRDTMLWWTPAQGVVQEPFLGLELKAAYDLIAQQQQEIATLKAQPPQPTVNVADAIAKLEVFGTAAANTVTLVLKDLGA